MRTGAVPSGPLESLHPIESAATRHTDSAQLHVQYPRFHVPGSNYCGDDHRCYCPAGPAIGVPPRVWWHPTALNPCRKTPWTVFGASFTDDQLLVRNKHVCCAMNHLRPAPILVEALAAVLAALGVSLGELFEPFTKVVRPRTPRRRGRAQTATLRPTPWAAATPGTAIPRGG